MTEVAWNDRGAPTSLPAVAAARELVGAHQAVRGSTVPLLPVAELVLALAWIETARTTAMWGYNWGNITAGSSWHGDFLRPSWYDPPPDASPKIQRLHALMLEHQAPNAFRLYGSHREGAGDLWRELYHAYPSILAAAATGDVAQFVNAIRSSGYSRDYTDASIQTLTSLRQQFRDAGVFQGLGLPPGGASSGPSPLVPLVAFALVFFGDQIAQSFKELFR